jgi:hypothetical protein
VHLPELHRAAWREEEDDGLLHWLNSKRYLVRASSGLVRWAERTGKLSLIFFLLSILFYFLFLFSFLTQTC